MYCEALHKEENTLKNQKRTTVVIIITVITMIAEISSGIIFGSIALLSDGIHMGTHTLALMITLFAYIIARKNARNGKFTFGTGKVSVLGGYTSAIALLLAAFVMIWESADRIISPIEISFNQSILVAVVGLLVNLLSAYILKDDHHDSHTHEDHNLKAAYLHVLADALTSILAIGALIAGKYAGLIWFDPLVGFIGATVIIKWGIGLIKSTGSILLDYESDENLKDKVISRIEDLKTYKIEDIHIWQVASGKHALICKVKNNNGNESPEELKHELDEMEMFCHTTIEVS